jgi:hypothetical protein
VKVGWTQWTHWTQNRGNRSTDPTREMLLQVLGPFTSRRTILSKMRAALLLRNHGQY